ncbi:MAG: hypothetical protein KKE20_03055 [Nanoarchaeota archaeon]|nr:hypothetical protein [Nanoarchaeota archaeon]
MEPYMERVKSHKDLAKYNLKDENTGERVIDSILSSYNGRVINRWEEALYTGREAAQLALNTLMCASESARNNGGAGKHYGVGFSDLEPAAKLGVYLMERCGIEDGRKILKDFIKMHYTQGLSFTPENVRNTLTLFDLLQNGPPMSHDNQLHNSYNPD